MSQLGELRTALNTIYDMIPLSPREEVLVDMIVSHHENHTDMEKHFTDNYSWWGQKAIRTVNALPGYHISKNASIKDC